jgi:hypothetical protein
VPGASGSGCSHKPSQQWAMAWPPQSGQGMKSAASSRGAAGPGSGSAARRIKPGRSVQRQVAQSMALAPKCCLPPRLLASMSAAIHRGVIARSSDSRTFRNAFGAARKKVFL